MKQKVVLSMEKLESTLFLRIPKRKIIGEKKIKKKKYIWVVVVIMISFVDPAKFLFLITWHQEFPESSFFYFG